MRSFHKTVLIAALALLAVVSAQDENITPARVPSSRSNSLDHLAVGPYHSASAQVLSKRACASGCCELGYSVVCGSTCCQYSCSKFGSGCGCSIGQTECSANSCCPALTSCVGDNKCRGFSFGGGSGSSSSGSKQRSSGAVAALMAMGAVFANV